MKLELIATATFGLEAVVRRELEDLGYKIVAREDGRITYVTNEAGLARSNLRLRTADRVLLKMGEFKANTFEDIFQGMCAIAWETLIPLDGNFVIGATSVKSQLSSVPACQSVAEKGLITRLQETYGEQRFSKSGARYDVKLRLLKDVCTVTVDTSGAGLHKRGYRTGNVAAPIKETLAAALVQLSFWKAGRLLVDPFCGSGTIAIEAAMIGRNIAPGIGRKFAAEDWSFIKEDVWEAERKAAYEDVDHEMDIRICASDISESAIRAAKENAAHAGVDDCIDFSRKSFAEFTAAEERGIIVCNPPYGERIGELKEIEAIYKSLAAFYRENPTWSLFLITTDKDFERKAIGRPADRRRKLYNGRLETTFYQYHGIK
ncbi:MAG: class I SAM-dependent RNA methyltransferase [Clostridiales Family XIII bacterium]|jgi:putative N6-adenine-specific DNA methylase|nr:class I SAM-dependent RNA methyltransferase [Clostridiales Family XIII bacterium]